MSPKRRLRGIAALSAATLASTGIAGTASAQDECTDPECIAEQIRSEAIANLGGMDPEAMAALMAGGDGTPDAEALQAILEGQGLGLPPEIIEMALALYALDGDARFGTEGQAHRASTEGQSHRAAAREGLVPEELQRLIVAAGGEEIPEQVLAELAETYAQAAIDASRDVEEAFAKAGPTEFDELPPEFQQMVTALGGAEALAQLPEGVLAQIAEEAGVDLQLLLEAVDPASQQSLLADPGEEAFIKIDGVDASLDDVFAGLDIDPTNIEVAQQVLLEDDPIKLQAIQQILDS